MNDGTSQDRIDIDFSIYTKDERVITVDDLLHINDALVEFFDARGYVCGGTVKIVRDDA